MDTPIHTSISPGASGRPERVNEPGRVDEVVVVGRPEPHLACPVLLASPHSGRHYDPELCLSTRLPIAILRRSEDAYVDQLVACAPDHGATLVCAQFPRVFVDVNRGPGELDPGMFSDRVPAAALQPSRRAASGLGVIPRTGAEGRSIYQRKLRYEEARARLERFYHPYHTALQAEISDLKSRFGMVVMADMHSMPALSGRGADIVLGDRYGTSCSQAVTDKVEAIFQKLGLVTVRNNPYAGGFTTEHYGRPLDGVNVIQIEISRGLYMNETRVTLSPDHVNFMTKMRHFISALTQIDWASQQ